MPDQREPKQAGLGRQFGQPGVIGQSGGLKPKVGEPGTGPVQEGVDSKFLEKPPQLAGGRRPLDQVDEMHLDPPLSKETEGLPAVRTFPGSEHLDFHYPSFPVRNESNCTRQVLRVCKYPMSLHLLPGRKPGDNMFRTSVLAALLAVGGTVPLFGQGWVDIERRPGVVAPFSSIVRTSSQVRVTVEGRVARVEVEEQFRNTGGGVAEGTYLYPMPGEAVFTDFSLWMGEQEVRGEMMQAEQARGIYEEIVRRLRDPALLTLEGHGLIRARVFPIAAGDTRKIVLRYTQMLDRSGDALRLRYAIGNRSQRETGRGDVRVQPGDVFSFRVTLPDASTMGTPYSPTHQITTRETGGHLVVTLDPDASGDVDLFIPLRRGLVGTSLVTHAPGGEDGFFMLLLSPPTSEEGNTVPRDLSLVVDVSGSMSGEKIEQARAAILQALESLNSADRFRLIAFSSTVRNFRQGFVPATPANIAAARRFAENLNANGGTNIEGALNAVLDQAPAEERLPIIIFMTDGIPSIGEQAPDKLAEAAAAHVGRNRIFTFGVGHDVNTYLLDRLSREGRGSAEYVAPDADVEVAVGSLVSKIQHPALVNLRIVESPVRLVQSYPGELPDLFFGEELVVFGRYRGEGKGTVIIEGERNGRRERFTARAEFPETEDANDFIPKLWASRRIGELTRQIRIEGASQDLVSQVRDLGLRYGILTEYTSYLVQEPGMAQNSSLPRDRAQQFNGQGAPPAASPEMQTGTRAFESADASSKMAAAGTLADAERVAERRMDELSRGSGAEPTRRAGGKVFRQDGAHWKDVLVSDSMPVTEVVAYSDAYFALVRALPEISQYLAVGDDLTIAGKRASIHIGSTGTRTWSQGQLERLLRAYRGQ
jgi:Ca-activated chloride channel family protein